MEEELILVKPSMEYEKQTLNFIEEVEKIDTDEKIRYSGFISLHRYKNNYSGWLEELEIYSNKETVPEGKEVGDVFFTVRKTDNKVVGIMSIRHELNDYLYNYGGHIGNGIRPSERGKGYGNKIIEFALKECKKLGIKRVLIMCLDYNLGSSKTIEKAGGVLENIVEEEKCGEKVHVKRYWISLKKRYADKNVGGRANKTDFKNISVQDKNFNGDIYFYNFLDVQKPIIIPNGKAIINNNYKWLEFYDYSSRVKLTAIYKKIMKLLNGISI